MNPKASMPTGSLIVKKTTTINTPRNCKWQHPLHFKWTKEKANKLTKIKHHPGMHLGQKRESNNP